MTGRRHYLVSAATVSVLFGSLAAAPETFGQLRIVTYNTNNNSSSQALPRHGMKTILEALGDQTKAGFARPIDILLLQEQATLATSTAGFVDVLNSLYGAGTYARGSLQGATTGAGRPAMVYNTRTVQLLNETQASSSSTTAGPRATLRYEFRPMGYDSAADFYVYNSHFKAVDDSSSARRRGIEAGEIRANADALGEGALVIYAGDLNLYDASEPAFQTLLAAGPGQAFDPINRVGNWSNSNAYRDVHTQSPVTIATFPGQVTGGLDDRFDFQLVTGELLDGRGFDVIPNSYWAFGNTGTHALNTSLATGSLSALQARLPGYSSSAAATVVDALMAASDHLPVVADYRLPAKLAVSSPTLPTTVLRGGSVGGSLVVSNAAPVTEVIGADTLAYAITGSGALAASGSGSRAPLSAPAPHGLSFDTSVAGLRTGVLTVTSSSAQAASARFSQTYSVDVLDRAVLAKAAPGGGLLPETSDVGTSLTVTNAAAPLGARRATAAIARRALVGDPAWSVRGLGVGETIAAGGSAAGTVEFDSTGRLNGPVAATLSLGLEHANQSLPGAAADDLGWLSWELATRVTGRTGSGTAVVAAQASLAGLGLDATGGRGTSAVLAAGMATARRTLTMGLESAPAQGLFASELLMFTGTGSDTFVLGLTFDTTALGGLAGHDLVLGWLDNRPESPTRDIWVNAVAGNSLNLVSSTEPFVGSWTDYAQEFTVTNATQAIGAWGIDTTLSQVWAVLDHASQFAVIPRAPPPAGDTNLDGKVDVFDLVLVNTAGKYGTGLASVWAEGDFNSDGLTSVFDLVAINTAGFYGRGSYLPTMSVAAGSDGPAVVPEPDALKLAALAAVGLIMSSWRYGRTRRPALGC